MLFEPRELKDILWYETRITSSIDKIPKYLQIPKKNRCSAVEAKILHTTEVKVILRFDFLFCARLLCARLPLLCAHTCGGISLLCPNPPDFSAHK